MKKNFKYGFSYVELVFAMAIVVILMAVSAPFLTRKNYSQTGTTYGEYYCWAAYGCDATGSNCKWRLFEKSRYNSSTFDYIDGHEVDTCKFMKPMGANEYEVTLISGGGGGSMAIVKNNTDNNFDEAYSLNEGITFEDTKIQENGEYEIVKRDYLLKIGSGLWGEPGDVITFKTFLKSFDKDNEIKIGLCNTNYKDSFTAKNATNQQCIGKGGEGASYSESTHRGIDKKRFFKLLEVYDDAIYEGEPTEYFGSGNGQIDFNDFNILAENGLTDPSAESHPIKPNEIYAKLLELDSKDDTGTHTASNGGYTHFVIGANVENEYCSHGNCLVPGGEYAQAPQSVKKLIFNGDCESIGSSGSYCFGTKFQDVSKYSKYASGANDIVEFVTKNNNDKHIGLTNLNDLKEEYNVQNNYYGAGGASGGFTFYTKANNLTCKYVRKEGGIAYFKNDPAISDVPSVLKPEITCDDPEVYLSNIRSTSMSALKRTKGGMGSGGAIIIKW